MSGGSLDYISFRVEEVAQTIRNHGGPLYRAFADHLDLVAKALHDVEWVLSGDRGKGDDEAAIRACLAPGAELDQLRRDAEVAHKALGDFLSREAAS